MHVDIQVILNNGIYLFFVLQLKRVNRGQTTRIGIQFNSLVSAVQHLYSLNYVYLLEYVKTCHQYWPPLAPYINIYDAIKHMSVISPWWFPMILQELSMLTDIHHGYQPAAQTWDCVCSLKVYYQHLMQTMLFWGQIIKGNSWSTEKELVSK